VDKIGHLVVTVLHAVLWALRSWYKALRESGAPNDFLISSLFRIHWHTMPFPTPLQSFVGGLGLTLPVHAFLILNGDVFGISGFLHRAVQGSKEAITAVVGLVVGGALVAIIEAPAPFTPPSLTIPQVLLSGFLVGVGSKLSSGCTSGHMISGLSRFSRRSLAATATFFTTGAITARFLYADLPAIESFDWTLGDHGKTLLVIQAIPLAISTLLYLLPQSTPSSPSSESTTRSLRILAALSTSFDFALSLRLSNLTEPTRVLSFLLLPIHRAFDPSLAFLAVGALPLSILLYHFGRGPEKAQLGSRWAVPKGDLVDSKLINGAALFGVGWGISGICPGPGLVNFGRALFSGSGLTVMASWLGAMAVGGLVV
jgi:uncharacterized membrane protein YedE/YeeE